MALASKTLWVRPEHTYTSGLASARLRAIIPARELASVIPVAFLPLQTLARGDGLRGLGSLQALVLTKLSTPDVIVHERELEDLLDWLEGDGADLRVCADLADDYAGVGRDVGHPYPARYQERLGMRCDFVVPCRALAERLSPWAKRGIHVIEDPWETAVAADPRFVPGNPVRLVWFGNLGPITFGWLKPGLSAAVSGAGKRAVRLTFVTGEQRAALARELLGDLEREHPQLHTELVPWSVEATQRAIAEGDLVLLPQDTSSDWGRAKSHNRLVETLRGGRLAIASPIASYIEMERFAWVGADLGAGVRWALEHPAEAQARIEAGQRYVEGRFAPSIIGRRWADVLGVRHASAPTEGP
jgi:hypothetical protein